MLVRDVMVTEVVSVPAEASLKAAGKRMLARGIGSVVVTRDGAPAGIVTETDALIAGCVTDRAFADVRVDRVASSPLTTIEPGATLRTAIERMREHDISTLPVVDGLDLVGIVTMTDVLDNYADVVREIHEQEDRQADWEQSGIVEVGVEEPPTEFDRPGD
jgi:CBS domain-containing protein